MLKRHLTLFTAVTIVSFVIAASPSNAGNYKIINLGVPAAGYNNTTSVDINNSGQVIGQSLAPSSTGLPRVQYMITPDNGVWFRDDDADGGNDLMVDMNLPGASATLRALNDSGQIVGRINQQNGDITGFLWDKGVVTLLGSLGFPFSDALSINNSGQIVGGTSAGGVNDGNVTFIWQNGAMSLLTNLFGINYNFNGVLSRFVFINDVGEVAGTHFMNGEFRPSILRGGVMIDLGDLGGNRAETYGFNNLSQVVGWSRTATAGSNESDAFLWTDSVIRNLGSVSRPRHGWANDVNNKGQVVGSQGGANTFLWLPEPAYGLSPGLHFMPRLLPPSSGWVLNVIDAINDDGIILGWGQFEGNNSAFIMIPPPPAGLIVNTVGDAPDSDPTDGECNTGNVAENGQPECTMRAAIEEANAQAGLDTILFDIPGNGIPVIKVGTELPEITEQILIDGSTQPTADNVEISGSAALSANGLLISGGDSEIRNLLINNFAGNGLVLLTGDGNTIGNLSIGVGPDGVEDRGNDGHGIYILNSSNNKIGDAILSRRNTIAYNGQIGVFVEGGTGNTIRGNRLFANAGLGIDLAPKGVTPNDAGDGDGGANGLLNYPVIDSVEVGLVSTLRGTLTSVGGQTFEIDVYLNNSCDATGFGEGQTLIQSAPVFSDADGVTEFSIAAVVTPAFGQYITATSTDQDGNTSEFSPCVGAGEVILVDGLGAPIANKEFALFKVANDPPIFTETFIDNIMSDGDGIVDIALSNLSKGARIRIAKQLSSTASPRRTSILKSALSVNLDNAKFDSSSSKMSYFEISNTMMRDDLRRKVEMTHTTIALNLYVSIEFDATVAYTTNLQNAFRQASNYLYDVTDGQARLDTVIIVDNKLGWDIADIWIKANNLEWPRAHRNGLLRSGATNHFWMPRKFYGDSTIGRNQSAIENPLNTATPDSYRTFIHELGHYALGLGDEYVYTDGNGKCRAVPAYGFMQNQYPGGITRSEMSVNSMYNTAACQNTAQWANNTSSCWRTLEKAYQKSYAGIFASIIMPNERNLPGGRTFLLGPNDNLESLDVNVGAKVAFPAPHIAPGIPPKRYRLWVNNATPASDVEVFQIIATSRRSMKLGNTSDDGHMYFMGAPSTYTYTAAGVSRAIPATASRSFGAGEFSWFYGEGAVPALDTGSIFLSKVQGELSLIPSIALNATGVQYSLRPLNQFVSVPSLVTRTDSQAADSTDFTFDGSVYLATVSDTSSAELDFTVYATDNASNTYFFSSEVSVSALSEFGAVNRTAGSQANLSLRLDSSVNALKQIVLVTNYPPIRSGLAPSQIHAGKLGVVQVFPAVTMLSGFNSLQMRYPAGSVDSSLELTLRMHHWDDAAGAWTLVGGTVDTSQNEVSAEITELGTYALFTTDIQTDVDDDETETGTALPKRFEVHQNFPNPFNPTTVISYSLPVKAEVTIAIYNVLGQRVKLFDQGQQSVGEYSVTWDATDSHGQAVASGMYFYKISAGEFSATRKMVLLK